MLPHLYPHRDLAENSRLVEWEANCRAALPAILAELDRTDVVAVADLVRLLALVPREAGLRGKIGTRDRCGLIGW